MSRWERFFNYLPNIIWSMYLGVLEWIIPRSWYAKDVSNDIVLITGAASGLGRNLALEFAQLGSSLVLWDIDMDGLEKTKELVEKVHRTVPAGPNHAENFCLIHKVDMSKRENIYEIAKKVQSDLKDDRYVSILVNNAGIYHGLYLQELTDEQIERMFHVNTLSHFWTVRAFLPKMIECKRGHILEIASLGGLLGSVKQVDYCASKFAVVGFEQSLSMELDHLGLGDKIRTTSICPFFFKSNLYSGIDSDTILLSLTPEQIAKEAVLALRCNHSRLILPLYGYILHFLACFSNRKTLIAWSKALGIGYGLREIRGRALDRQ